MARIKLDPFSPAVASSTSTMVSGNIGYTLLNIVLKLTVITKAQLSDLRIALGGKQIWKVTGSHLDTMNSYFRYTANAAYLTLWFANPLARHSLGEFLRGALDMDYYRGKKLQIEADFAAGAGVGSKIEAFSDVVGAIPDKQSRGVFRTMNKAILSPAAAVSAQQQGIYTGGDLGMDIRGIHLFHTNVTKVNFTKDSQYLVQDQLNADIQFSQNELTRTTQAGHLCAYDATLYDKDSMALSTLRSDGKTLASLNFSLDTSALDSIPAYTDGLQTLDAV